MTIIKRADLGRPLTWDELDNNFAQVDSLVTTASTAVETATTQAQAASGFANAASQSSQEAQTAAASAGSAAEAAVAGIYSDFASSDVGKGASLVELESGRSVQDKSTEYLSAKDLGANGDGTTDQTSVFANFESSNKNRRVDLNGLYYFVTQIPAQNNYFNGGWVLNKTVNVSTTSGAGTSYNYNVRVNAALVDASVPLSVVERDARTSQSRLAFKLIQASGLQGLCFDEPNQKIYGMYFDTSSGSEQSVVVRYDMGLQYPASASPDLTTLASSQLGHQGLSLEYVTNSTPKLWGCGRYDATNYPDGGRQVIRFNVTDGASLSNVETYTLFGSDFSYNENATMVAVSYDQRWIVATGRKTSRDFWVRGFDMHMLTQGGSGDYSNKYSWQFNIDDDILSDDNGGLYTPIQNVACDGAFVYIVAGNATQQGKKIHQYSIKGKRVGRNNTVSVGLAQSQADGTFYEPEALAFYRPLGSSSPVLTMLVLTTGKNNYVWEMGSGTKTYSGSYTPTTTTVTNATGTTSYKCNFSRIDDIVTFSGRIAIQATASGSVVVRATLPVPIVSAGSLTQVQGAFNDQTTQGGRIQLDTSSGLMDFQYTANTTTNTAFSFTGSYRIAN